jgi:branched-chain amino acid transport system ATP-binding protein
MTNTYTVKALENTQFVFRVLPTSREFVPPFVKWLRENRPAIQKIALIAPNDETGWDSQKLQTAAYEQNGFKVVGAELFERAQTDFHTMLTKLIASGPDSIELDTTPPPTAGLVIRQARELGFKGQFTKFGGVNVNDMVKAAGAAIIGANGAGKSTLLKTLVGWMHPDTGRVLLDGADIGGLSPEARFRLGMALSPEGRRLFPGLTVDENLRMGTVGLGRGAASRGLPMSAVFDLFPRLAERRNSLGRELSGGEQQMCAIGRALIGEPRMLLLDEPSLGLAPKVVDEMARAITRIAERGVTIVLVEQNSRLALTISDDAHVLEAGGLRLSGPSKALLDDPRVIDAYLGTGTDDEEPAAHA